MMQHRNRGEGLENGKQVIKRTDVESLSDIGTSIFKALLTNFKGNICIHGVLYLLPQALMN